ncbi:biotin-protein ligase [Elysia marginata]|uniref:Biotin-protein ligase n=1 Tax=Elysia marginata TaxID=1093978 RepID=A0AAV4J427_9GAST|nr:biotin-protein ligase [Elysia marginata]
MLPLTLSSYLWAGVQIVRQTVRLRHYEQVLQSLLPSATVVVFQNKTSQGSEQLDSVPPSSGVVEFEDDFIRLYNMHLQREVDLTSWTCYTSDFKTNESANNTHQNIYVVVETRHVVDEQIKRTHPDLKVHVLGLGQPVAWKSTDHFDVIISCGLSSLVRMIDAFGQNRLHLDEDLKIKGFATIQPTGQPQPIYGSRNSSQEIHSSSAPSEKTTDNASNGATISKGSITTKISDTMLNCSSPSQNAFINSHKQKDVGSTKSAEFHRRSEREHQLRDDQTKKAPKPPNILVYCGADERSKQIYTSVKSSLSMCVNTDVYIIYHLTHIEMLTSPWVENTALLLLSSCPDLALEVKEKVSEFVFRHSGSLLSFDTSVESCFAQKINGGAATEKSQLFTFKTDESNTVTCLRGDFYYVGNQGVSECIVPVGGSGETGDHSTATNDVQQKALILHTKLDKGGQVVLSQLVLERDSAHSAVDSSSFVTLKSSNTARLAALKHILARLGMNVSPRATPDLTPCCLLTQKQELRKKFLASVHRKLDKESVLRSQNFSLTFLENAASITQVSPNVLPVITSETSSDIRLLEGFAEQDYWRNLDTTKLGQVVLYTDVITSTMHVFDGMLFSLPHGIYPVAIAGRQTSGRGRGGNMWLSPRGCAMFTFPLSFELDSEMGQRISFLQHLVSTAVVHGIRTLPGYQDLNLRLKWPNDIYYGKDMKLGGVIVTSTVMGSTIYSTIGCGVNVSNSDPTICINDIIELSNRSSGMTSGLIPLLSPAGVIARTLSTLEALLAQFEEHGHTKFCETYYKYWLHGGIKVSLNLETEDGHGEGEVVGLDEYGFLSVCKPSGETISVQPDGNSFDMMQNLVYCKRRV